MSKNITIARLNTLVTANAAQFTSEMEKAGMVARKQGQMIHKALSTVGGVVIGGSLIAGVKSLIDYGSKISDLASTSDLSARSLQTLSVLAGDNGVSMEEVAKASEKMRSNRLRLTPGAFSCTVGAMRKEIQTIRLAPDQLRQLARLTAAEIKRAGTAQVPDRIPELLTPKQATEYSGRSRRTVFYFMKAEPLACAVDATGFRRVSRRWLDAWCEGEHALAAMRRADA